jgi:hypothetical protein
LSDKGGVQYSFQAPNSPMLPVAATLAVSDQLFVAGSDPASVEAAIARGAAQGGGLSASQTFRSAERLVSPAKSASVYVDTAMLYGRLDAAIRPMLVLAAAFVPTITETVDLQKLPAPEIVTKHLSPLVLSQRYDGDGYITESIGPFSFYHAGIGLAMAAGLGTTFYDRQIATPNDTLDDSVAATPPAAAASPTLTPVR